MRKKRRKRDAPALWAWEFSKRVVSTAFVLYVVAAIYTLFVVYKAMAITMDAGALSTFITEINETFRVVVGGYMIKAAGENVVKISTAYLRGKHAYTEEAQKTEEYTEEIEMGNG